MAKATYLESDVLDRVWWRWLETAGPTQYEMSYLKVSYNRVPRRINKVQRFEQWLFMQGGEVRQISGKRYVQFTDEQEAMLFALKWA